MGTEHPEESCGCHVKVKLSSALPGIDLCLVQDSSEDKVRTKGVALSHSGWSLEQVESAGRHGALCRCPGTSCQRALFGDCWQAQSG